MENDPVHPDGKRWAAQMPTPAHAATPTAKPVNNEANLTPDTPHMELVCAYTQAQALADGGQVEVSNVAAEAGIRVPVFLTRTVFDAFVTVPEGLTGQDEAGRLWDIVWMLHFAIRKSQHGQNRLPFALYVRNDNRKPRLVKLIATCGPLDIDDAPPAITVMMPDEDLTWHPCSGTTGIQHMMLGEREFITARVGKTIIT